jgi:hypothetical protein
MCPVLNRSFLTHALSELIVPILILMMCSCVHSPTPATSRFIDPDLPADRYAVEIENQKKTLEAEKIAERRATASYNLALLYLSFRNPDKDYQAAQQYLIKSAALDTSIAGKYAVKNVLNMLNEMNRISSSKGVEQQRAKKMKTDYKALNNKTVKLEKKYNKCTQDNIQLIQENVDLKMSIERLKKLDLEIEQKRKTFK